MSITVGDIAKTIMIRERSARSLLHEVNPEIDLLAENPDEEVARENIIDLIAVRQDSRTQKLLMRLLREDEAQTMTPNEIRTARARLGLTQTQLAIRLGVSLPTVQRWEAGQFVPSLMARERLQALLAE